MPPAAPPKRPVHKTWWFWALMAISVIVILGAAFIARSFASDAQARSAAEEAALDVCDEGIRHYAKYPAAVEYPKPLAPIARDAEPQQGPEGTAYVTVTLGQAHFSNAFGVPTEYDFGCVTYHDGYGEYLDSTVKVTEAGIGIGRVMYDPNTDTLSTIE